MMTRRLGLTVAQSKFRYASCGKAAVFAVTLHSTKYPSFVPCVQSLCYQPPGSPDTFTLTRGEIPDGEALAKHTH
jgi:hypothetical protein